MKLKVHAIAGKGDLAKELVWLQVLEDCQLDRYLIADTTYTDDRHISNEIRHTYWFAATQVKKGDWVALHTKAGKKEAVTNDQKTTTHTFYWNLGRTLWNKDGDCAVLFEVAGWNTTRA